MNLPLFKKIKNGINRYRLYQKNKSVLPVNRKLKDLHRGQRCFIIGTGPSIKTQDLVKLKNEQTLVANEFWNHPDYYEISPKYYILIDADVFPQPGRSELWGSSYRKELEEKIQLLESHPTKFFFHINGKDFIEKKGGFQNNEVFYMSFAGHFKENLKFNVDLDKILPNPKNVIVAAIEIAVYMGFGEIYLLGCEHSYLAHPNLYDNFEHFYETKKYNQNDPEEVKKYALNIMPYESYIHHIKILFQNYRLLKTKLAKENPHVRIYNATPNSFLDVFPLIKFEDIKL